MPLMLCFLSIKDELYSFGRSWKIEGKTSQIIKLQGLYLNIKVKKSDMLNCRMLI